MTDMPKEKGFIPNKEQKAVIESKAKHLLVVAGAGSGKTSTLVARICHFVSDGARPQSILGLTFTKKASLELAKRAANRLKERKEQLGSIKVKTYDSFIQSIVRQYGLLICVDPQLTPLSEAGVSQCIAKVLEDNYECIGKYFREIEEISPTFSLPSIHPGSYSSADLQSYVKNFTSQTLNFFIDEDHLSFKSAAEKVQNWIKAFDRDLEDLEDDLEKNGEEKAVEGVKQLRCNAKLNELVIELSLKYAERREKNNLAEYGDFTLYALKIIHELPEIAAEEYRKKFSHVFLDEYQDTNHTQGILIKLLFKDGPTVTAVGDPQQAIYGFRGATPGAFDYYMRAFGDVEMLTLPETFRNKKNVVDLANRITEHLPGKERLSLRSRGEGGNICALIYKHAADSGTGPRAALEFIKKKLEEKPDEKIAILGRDNGDLSEYYEILTENGIDCILTGKSKFDDENPIARDLREILSVAVDPFASKEAEGLLLSPRYSFSLGDMRKLADEVRGKNKEMNPGEGEKYPDPVLTLPIYLRSLDKREIKRLNLSSKDGKADRRSGEEILDRFVKNVKSVESASFSGLESAVMEAWRVLDLNADIAIADEFLDFLPYEKLTLEDALEAVKAYKADLDSDQSPTVQGFLGWIKNYQKDLRPQLSEEGKTKTGSYPVELMTIHQAKGLEWDDVVVVGMQNDFNLEKKDHLQDLKKEGKIPTIARKAMWINSPGAIPANLRADLDYCDKTYGQICRRFDDLSNVQIDGLSANIADLYEEEMNRAILEEAHVAYVAMTRTKGDLLLISACPYDLVSKQKGPIANIENHGGLFWNDAVKFILGSDKDFGQQVESAIKDNVALFSTDEELKKLLEDAVAQSPAEDKKDEDLKKWPVQIREDIREDLQEGARMVQAATKEGAKAGKLYKRAKALIGYESSVEKERKEMIEHLNLLSTTDLQKLSISGGSLKDFIRPMPSHPSAQAEAGTEFHAWAAAYLLDPSEAEKVKINKKYEKISRWQCTFKESDWSQKRKCWGTELPYCISLDRGNLGKIVVTAKLDAVFKGDLEGNREEEAFTIVDWKTGKVPDNEKLPGKLLQLDIYRLALSKVLQRDIASIYACLYYVSHGGKQISAKDKSEEEILDEILKIDEGKLKVTEDE